MAVVGRIEGSVARSGPCRPAWFVCGARGGRLACRSATIGIGADSAASGLLIRRLVDLRGLGIDADVRRRIVHIERRYIIVVMMPAEQSHACSLVSRPRTVMHVFSHCRRRAGAARAPEGEDRRNRR